MKLTYTEGRTETTTTVSPNLKPKIGLMKNNNLIQGLKYLSLTIIVLFFHMVSQKSVAQNTVKVDTAIGTCIISNITPEQARKTAIIEAKNEALILAGVSERVMVYSTLETFSANDTTIEYFSSLSNIVTKGQVLNWKVLSERRYVNELDNFVYEVVIEAEVIKYNSKPDPNFSAYISGLKSVYYEGESLEFYSMLSQVGYVYVFLINDDETSQLYPNPYEKEKEFIDLKKQKFPTDENIEYELTVDENSSEKNTLVFVVTKKKSTPIIFNSQGFFKWLYSMEPDQVFYSFYPINILRKQQNVSQ